MLRLSQIFRLQSTIKVYSKELLSQMRNEIDTQLKKIQSLSTFSEFLSHDNIKLHQKVYGLSLLDEKYFKSSHEEIPKKIFLVFDQIKQNIKNLDPLGLLEFTKFLSKYSEANIFYLNRETEKKVLIEYTSELLNSNSFNDSQLISLFKNLDDIRVSITKLNDEIERITIESADRLSVKQISKIISGYGTRNFTMYKHLLDLLLERLSRFKASEIDYSSAIDILETLTLCHKNSVNRSIINDFFKILEPSMNNWDEYQTLKAASVLNRIDYIPLKNISLIWSKINKALKENENLDTSFYIDVLKIKLNKDKITNYQGSWKIALNLALKANYIKEDDYLTILKNSQNYLFSYENALLLKNHAKKMKFKIPQNCFEAIKYLSYLNFQSSGLVYAMDSLISIDDIPSFSSSINIHDNFFEKIMILDCIFTTKNYENKNLRKYSQNILNQIIEQCSSDSFWVKKFIAGYNNCFDSELSSITIQFLQPMKQKMLDNLVSQIVSTNDSKTLLYAINVLGHKSEEWQFFKKKYDPLFTQEQINHAIDCINTSFTKINEILSVSQVPGVFALNRAVRKIEIATPNELNDFLIILSKLPANKFIKNLHLILFPELLHKIIQEGDFSLISNLFEESAREITVLDPREFKEETIWRFLYLLSEAQKLNQDIADKFISYADINLKHKHFIYPIILAASNQEKAEDLIKRKLSRGLRFTELLAILQEIFRKPSKEFIDEIFINEIKGKQFNTYGEEIYGFIRSLIAFEKNKNEHRKLFDCVVTLFTETVNKNIKKLKINEINNLFELKNCEWFEKLDWNGISKHLLSGPESDKITSWNPIFLNVLAESGFYNENIFNGLLSNQPHRSWDTNVIDDYLSFLADFKPIMKDDNRGNSVARTLIDTSTMKLLIFQNNFSTIKWLYGLINFKGLDSEIERHYQNAKKLELKNLTFKHVLVENYIGLNFSNLEPDFDLQQNFDFLSYFGLNKNSLEPYKLLFKKEGVEVKENQFVNNIWTPLYLTKKRIALWPISNNILFYGQNALKGEFFMHKENLKQMCEDVVFIPKYEESMKNIDSSELLAKYKLTIG